MHAAAGGVGHLAVQLARARGARVIGTAAERNHDYLRGLGAEPVAYGEGLADRVRALAPDGVDAALDLVGRGAVQVSAGLVAAPAGSPRSRTSGSGPSAAGTCGSARTPTASPNWPRSPTTAG